jgi:hypothetical protein
MKTGMMLFGIFLLPLTLPAQESVRQLDPGGQHSKYLTPGQQDTWILEAEKGETLIAHVATREFDAILELAVKGDKEDRVLFSVDDEGSDSRFSFRVPEKGEYRIRIHAFKYNGGGNYTLRVRRFQARPLELGKPFTGAFDHEGQSYLYFQGVKGRILVPELRGSPAGSWKMLDHKGRELRDWVGTVLVEEEGEHTLIISGRPDNRYDLLVREARSRDPTQGKEHAGRLQQGEMDVWSFQGQPGDFRFLEVEKKGEMAARLIFAPLDKMKEQRLARAGNLPEIQFAPVANRGSHLRFAAVLGRSGRYQLQLLAQTPASYTLSQADPTAKLDRGQPVAATLPVGGSAFFSFKATPGQMVQASLESKKFVPLLRLYDGRGSLVDRSDESAGGLEALLSVMILKEGLYRLQISSLGDGGGGDFRLLLQDRKLKELALGGRGQASVAPNSPDFWLFAGKEGQTVLLCARSPVCDPVVGLYSPEGVLLASDGHRPAGTDSLQTVRLPRTGRYTVRVSSRRGAGEYTLRIIDGD